MVKDSSHCKALVITIIRIVGGSWKTFYPSAGKLCAMSRCYPYPPPGYEKKAQTELGAQAELGLTHKKEKHKHKDKKKKKKRESDANGDSHDKDKKSKKSQRTQPAIEVSCTKNGKIPEVKDMCPLLPLKNTLQRTDSAQAGSSRSERNLDGAGHDSAACSRRKEADWRIEGRLPMKVETPAGTSNGTTAAGMASSSGYIIGSQIDLLKQRVILAVPQTSTEVWSAIDDQEWLFLTDNQLHSKSRGKKVEAKNSDGDFQVWDEVKLLPSVDIYALPYVVPY